jgi:hypothetical protein
LLPNTYVDPALFNLTSLFTNIATLPLVRSSAHRRRTSHPDLAAYSTYKTKYTKRYSADEAVNGHATNGDENKAVKVAVEAESFDYILFHS